MQKFRIGMNIRDVITAANMNEIADAVNAVKENQNNLPTRQIGGRTYQTGEIRIKFSDPGTLDRFAAVALTGLELTAENCDTFAFEVPTFTAGKVTAARKDMPFAICLEPANSGELSKALVTGVTTAKVTIRDAAHQYAQPIPDSSTGALESCESGTARILFKSGGSGEQWCILQLGSGGSGGGAVEYNGYFTLKTRVENDAVKIVVCDGATYNEENGTSQASVCKVNNAYFDVPYISLDPVSPGKYIILVYDPSYGTRGRVTVEQVTRMSEEDRPSYIIGTYTVAGDGKINIIIQRHGTVATQFMANGVAAIEYYLDPCQEEQ